MSDPMAFLDHPSSVSFTASVAFRQSGEGDVIADYTDPGGDRFVVVVGRDQDPDFDQLFHLLVIGFLALERSESDSPLGHCFDSALRATDSCSEGRPAWITVCTDDPARLVLHFRARGESDCLGEGGGGPEELGAFLRANFDLAELHASYRAIYEEFFAD